jgi:hypothetical protein
MIHIITPCSRPENLEYLRESIPAECKWLVMLDYSTRKSNIPKGINVMRSNFGGAWGAPLRNAAIDYLQISASHNDYVYFLDDDNIIHPDWYQTVKDCNEDFVNWAQVFRNGEPRLRATESPRVGNIDTASFMVKIGAIGKSRFQMLYEADGLFAQEVYKKGTTRVINDYLCYYNYLR